MDRPDMRTVKLQQERCRVLAQLYRGEAAQDESFGDLGLYRQSAAMLTETVITVCKILHDTAEAPERAWALVLDALMIVADDVDSAFR